MSLTLHTAVHIREIEWDGVIGGVGEASGGSRDGADEEAAVGVVHGCGDVGGARHFE